MKVAERNPSALMEFLGSDSTGSGCQCPGFWNSVVHHHGNGRVFSVDRVRSELLAGHKADDLVQWERDEVPEGFFVPVDTEVVVGAYTEVMMWVQRHPRYFDYAKAKFATGADGWLVAYAITQGSIVVTNEQCSPESRREIKLPDVCDSFRVQRHNTFSMLRALNVHFDWAGDSRVTGVMRKLPSVRGPLVGVRLRRSSERGFRPRACYRPSRPSSPSIHEMQPMEWAEPQGTPRGMAKDANPVTGAELTSSAQDVTCPKCGAFLGRMPACGCEYEVTSRYTIWPSGDSHGVCDVDHATAEPFVLSTPALVAARLDALVQIPLLGQPSNALRSVEDQRIGPAPKSRPFPAK